MQYFKHSTDARENHKWYRLRTWGGWAAYGRGWAIFEIVGQHFTEKESFALPAQYPLEKMAKDLDMALTELEDLLGQMAELELIDPAAWQKKRIYTPKMAERCDKYTEKLRREGKLNLPDFRHNGTPKKARKSRKPKDLPNSPDVPTRRPQTGKNVLHITEQNITEQKRKKQNREKTFNLINELKAAANPDCAACGGSGFLLRENAVVGPRITPCECLPENQAMALIRAYEWVHADPDLMQLFSEGEKCDS